MKTLNILPPDVTAYMISAFQEIAAQKMISPKNETETAELLEKYHLEICSLARDKMKQFALSILTNEEMKKAVIDHLSGEVHNQINASRNDRNKYNERFVRFCTLKGVTVDEYLSQNDSMTEYICWKE